MSGLSELHPYELALLVLGSVLAVVLLGLLARGKLRVVQYPLFLVAIAMIGFPSVQAVEIAGWKVQLRERTQEVRDHPDDQESRDALAQLVGKAEARVGFANEQYQPLLADANSALGKYDVAWKHLDQALKTETPSSGTTAIAERVGSEILTAKTPSSASAPRSSADAQLLTDVADTLDSLANVKPETLELVAKTNLSLGRTDAARATVNRLQRVQPNLKLNPDLLKATQPK